MSSNQTSGAMRAYQKIDAYSGAAYADPHQLIVMLMDSALDRLARAKGAMQQGNIAFKGELIGNSISIIGGLKGCLDMDAGGELSNNLDDLYDYMSRRLVQANLGNDPGVLDEVSALLREIKAAWDAIPDDVKKQTSGREQLGHVD
jgi:flagellar protein FliS